MLPRFCIDAGMDLLPDLSKGQSMEIVVSLFRSFGVPMAHLPPQKAVIIGSRVLRRVLGGDVVVTSEQGRRESYEQG